MGLDDREQRILAEIERRFYEEDPDLADAVRNISKRAMSPGRVRLAAVGVFAGLGLLLWTFTFNVWIALVGFGLLVVSASTLVHAMRARSGRAGGAVGGARGGLGSRLGRFRRYEQD
ncbi:MAG: DUF3040 domain-containing protein [Acidimicrobiia bacterium]|nr:DUF3040 domain-containing protein [Acidimicrobiia bacterium]